MNLTPSSFLTMNWQVRYPGGKGKSYQRIINLMPPHRTYIESHLGGGAVLQHKQPASLNIGIDLDPRALGRFSGFGPTFKFICADAIDVLDELKPGPDTLLYADPPYFPTTRRRARVYRHDYNEADHEKLLQRLRKLECMVMISGYRNELYDTMLRDWRSETFSAMSHTGPREETVWMNFQPNLLHDIRFVGETFRDRGAMNLKCRRWRARFEAMEKPYQQALLTDLVGIFLRDLPDKQRAMITEILLTQSTCRS